MFASLQPLTETSTVPTITDLGSALGAVLEAFTVSWVAGVLAIAGLGMIAVNYPPIKQFLRGLNDWLRPLIILVLTLVSGFFGAYAGGVDIVSSVVAAFTAAFASGALQVFLQQATDGDNIPA